MEFNQRDYYNFFKNAGWVDSELEGFKNILKIKRTAKNIPPSTAKAVIRYCQEVIYKNSKDAELAVQVLDLFQNKSVKLQTLLHAVAYEHVKQKLGLTAHSGVVNAVIKRILGLSSKQDQVNLKILALESRLKALPNLDAILRPFILKLTEGELILLAETISQLPETTTRQLLNSLSQEVVQEKIVSIVKKLRPDEIKPALESMLRLVDIPTHKWTNGAPKKKWEFVIGRKIKEMAIWQKSFFIGARTSIWKESMPLREGVKNISMDSVAITNQELGLLINEKYLQELRSIGGKDLHLEHANGDKIHTMQFSALDFASSVKQTLSGLELLKEGTTSNGQPIRCYKIEDKPSQEIQTLISLGLLTKTWKSDFLEIDGKSSTVNSLFGENVYVMYPPLVSKQEEPKSTPKPTTAIICAGSGVWFGVYKSMIARLLLSGVDVMAFSYRGYEHSEGVPTDNNLFEDVDAVGHYLTTQGVADEQKLIYASCMGLGPAAHYLKKHSKCDIFIDRSFASLGNLAGEFIAKGKTPIRRFRKLASKVAKVAIPRIIHFKVIKPLQKAQGTVAIVTAKKDDILQEQKDVLQQKAEPDISIISRKNHSGNWLTEPDVLFHFETFLIETNHARKLDLF